MDERIVKPWSSAEQGLGDKAKSIWGGSQRADYTQDAVLAIHAVCHSLVWQSATGRSNSVESVEGGWNPNRAACSNVNCIPYFMSLPIRTYISTKSY